MPIPSDVVAVVVPSPSSLVVAQSAIHSIPKRLDFFLLPNSHGTGTTIPIENVVRSTPVSTSGLPVCKRRASPLRAPTGASSAGDAW